MEFEAFLSHRYKSPEVNLYFHDIFRDVAEMQFKVDIGRLSTSVTRLERMIRDADAFVGLYPYDGDPRDYAAPEELLKASRYFRLETEIATRARCPGLVFMDERYAPYFHLPPWIQYASFDIQEITGAGGSPARAGFRNLIESFCKQLRDVLAAKAQRPSAIRTKHVGLLLPDKGQGRYTEADLQILDARLRQAGMFPHHFDWPPVLAGPMLAELEAMDFLVIDIGKPSMASGIVGYLHGRGIPCIRLLKGQAAPRLDDQIARALFCGVDAGYPKDILPWTTQAELADELDNRLYLVNAPTERISSTEEAISYFQRASMRKQNVFVSYAGADTALAKPIIAELKTHFRDVFDYKDGESITPGQPWLAEIFDKLSTSALGIPLVSANYFASGNCRHEAEEMIARQDNGQMAVIPLKLKSDDTFELPSWMRNRQYLHAYDYGSAPEVVAKIVQFFERADGADGAKSGTT